MATADGRRRGCSPTAGPASSTYFPPELIPEIARRLTTLEDFFALRASCRAYRAVLPLTASNLASQAPLLLLYHRDTDSYALFNLPLRRRLRFRLPGLTNGVHPKSLGCRVYREVSGVATEIRILHPFTGEEARLPAPPDDFSYVVLTGDLVVAFEFDTIQYCRLNDGDWLVASVSGPYEISDFISVNGSFYMLLFDLFGVGARVAAVKELSNDNGEVKVEFLGGKWDARYHVEPEGFSLGHCCGELILLNRVLFDDGDHTTVYHVFQWMSEEAKWARITSFGGFTLFVTDNSFVGCLGPDHPGIRGDCIYVTDYGGWSEYSSVDDGSFHRSASVYLGEELGGFSTSDCWVLPSIG